MTFAICCAIAGLAVVRPTPPKTLSASQSSQVLSLYDRKSKLDVLLVGTMHFNPPSIQLARDVVNAEAEAGRLRAILIESCPTRWNATLEMQPAGSALRLLCDNEMQSAAEAGDAAGVETILADQSIEETGRRISQLAALTLAELATPWSGGWNRIWEDLVSARAQVLAGDGLGAGALLSPRLWAGFPLSLLRYPLSIVLKSPAVGVLLVGLFVFLGQDVAADSDSVGSLVRASSASRYSKRSSLVAFSWSGCSRSATMCWVRANCTPAAMQ